MGTGQRRTAHRIRIGAALKRLRTEAAVPRELAAETIGRTTTTIGNIEQGRTRIGHGDLLLLARLYRVPREQVADLVEVNRAAHRAVTRITGGSDIPPHQRRAADLVAAARLLRYYSPEVFPGLLQHEDYARAVLAPACRTVPGLAARLGLRLGLAEALTGDEPVRVSAIVGEAALRNTIGGPQVMRRQLRHVVSLCRTLPAVTVQVLPFTAREHELIGTTVTIYTLDPAIPEVVGVASAVGEQFFDRDPAVTEAAARFADVRAKALDPRTSVDLLRRAADRR